MNDHYRIYYPLFLLISLSFFLSLKCVYGFNNDSTSVKCLDTERRALLKFKHGLEDDSGVLSTWDDDREDCCNWWGVQCSNETSHVVSIDLHGVETFLQIGEVSFPVLTKLNDLRYLDLSYNHIYGGIDEAIGSFRSLEHLNLSNCIIGGVVPPQLGNLSNLQTLDLRWNIFSGAVPHQLGNLSRLRTLDLGLNINLTTNNLVWLSQLRLLRHLDLTGMNLEDNADWKQVIFRLPFLEELHLPHCQLRSYASHSSLPRLLNSSSDSLSVLDLSNNYLISWSWLFNISKKLVSIDLSDNDLQGPIPDAFGDMFSLRDIFLHGNDLTSGIPKSFQSLRHLCTLSLWSNNLSEAFPEFLQKLSSSSSSLSNIDLNNNRFTGSLPVNIGEFSNLEYLDVSSNLLDGTISEHHFSNLSDLKYLSLSLNSLSLNISPTWVPGFELDHLKLANCSVGPRLPRWLTTQTGLVWLDLSFSGLSETIPAWFFNSSFELRYLNLSYNQINGRFQPELSQMFGISTVIDLSSNNCSGPILSVPHDLSALYLRKNAFTGPISFLCASNSYQVKALDLSDNLFSGELPDCWMNMIGLIVLDLSNNRLSGPIPESLGFLQGLETLHLQNNRFIGEIPPSIRNCWALKLIDVGRNRLTGSVPSWIGMFLTNLAFLSLRSNSFSGSVPQNICHLSSIRVLDLSQNNLSGEIPKCFNNFTFFVQKITPSDDTSGSKPTVHEVFTNTSDSSYADNMWVQWKRSYSEYDKILGQLKIIDLSDNKFDGEIPKEFASLKGLISLNLSVNNLTGNIVSHIDQMEMLEVLDLSRNHLSGEIPAGLGQLHFLAVMNLSYNNLYGRIPLGTQLQSFDPSAYAGNVGLCGFPLDKCLGDDNDSRPTVDHGKDDKVEDKDGSMSKEEYMVSGLGFLVGLCGVVVVLCKGSWRNAYFRLLEDSYDWFYVRIIVYWLKLKRRCTSSD